MSLLNKIREFFSEPMELGVHQAMAVTHKRMEEIYNELEFRKAQISVLEDENKELRKHLVAVLESKVVQEAEMGCYSEAILNAREYVNGRDNTHRSN